VDWTYSQAIGWVRVRVRDEDAEAAGELLAADLTEQLPPLEGEADSCPSCGTEWHYVEKGSRWLMPSLLSGFPFLFLAFLVVPRWRPRLVCRNCGWKKWLPIRFDLSKILPWSITSVVGGFIALSAFAIAGWLFVFLFELSSSREFIAPLE
jgi:hypothetical protein